MAHSPDDLARQGLDQKSLTGIAPLIIFALLCCTSDAAECMRIRAINGEVTAGLIARGTCVAIAKHEILTAWHVVKDKETVQVEIEENEWVPATMVAHDEKEDLALVTVEAKLKYRKLAKDSDLTVYVSDNGGPVTKHRTVFYRTVLAYGCQNGVSGSAVLDSDDRVTGIICGYEKEGAHWAHCIPVEEIHKFLAKVKDGGK